MSPLARSLLALAATLAVATAQSNCDIQDPGFLGQRDVPLQRVNAQCPVSNVIVENYCPIDVPYMCGLHIVVCNPNYGLKPTIGYVDPVNLSPVPITCNDPREQFATVDIILHCCVDPPYSPPSRD